MGRKPKAPKEPNDPNILTTEQLADRLGCSVQTLQRWARAGKIPALRAGKDLRFQYDKVLAALEAHHAGRIEARRNGAAPPAEPDLDAIATRPTRRRTAAKR